MVSNRNGVLERVQPFFALCGFVIHLDCIEGVTGNMNKLMRLIAWIFLFLVFLASIAFSFFNTVPVPLSFGFVVLSPQPLSLWVVLAFAAGGLLGLFLGFGLSGNWRSSKSLQHAANRSES